MLKRSQICIVTGAPQCGKTSFLRDVIEDARNHNLSPGGFIAIGLWQNYRRSGFILEELESGVQTPLSCRSAESREIGGYVFHAKGFDAGLRALQAEALMDKDIVVIDEVGWLEIRGGGWAPALAGLIDHKVKQIWVVRDSLVNKTCETWKFEPALIINPNDSNAKIKILAWLESKNS